MEASQLQPHATFAVPLPFWATKWSCTEMFDNVPFSWRKQLNVENDGTETQLKEFYKRLFSIASQPAQSVHIALDSHPLTSGRAQGMPQLPRKQWEKQVWEIYRHLLLWYLNPVLASNPIVLWVLLWLGYVFEAPSNLTEPKTQIPEFAVNILAGKKLENISVFSLKYFEILASDMDQK